MLNWWEWRLPVFQKHDQIAVLCRRTGSDELRKPSSGFFRLKNLELWEMESRGGRKWQMGRQHRQTMTPYLLSTQQARIVSKRWTRYGEKAWIKERARGKDFRLQKETANWNGWVRADRFAGCRSRVFNCKLKCSLHLIFFQQVPKFAHKWREYCRFVLSRRCSRACKITHMSWTQTPDSILRIELQSETWRHRSRISSSHKKLKHLLLSKCPIIQSLTTTCCRLQNFGEITCALCAS